MRNKKYIEKKIYATNNKEEEANVLSWDSPTSGWLYYNEYWDSLILSENYAGSRAQIRYTADGNSYRFKKVIGSQIFELIGKFD